MAVGFLKMTCRESEKSFIKQIIVFVVVESDLQLQMKLLNYIMVACR